jgi:hypothetical protein
MATFRLTAMYFYIQVRLRFTDMVDLLVVGPWVAALLAAVQECLLVAVAAYS